MIRARSEVTIATRACLLAVALGATAASRGRALPQPEASPSVEPGRPRFLRFGEPPPDTVPGCTFLAELTYPPDLPDELLMARAVASPATAEASLARLRSGRPPQRAVALYRCVADAPLLARSYPPSPTTAERPGYVQVISAERWLGALGLSMPGCRSRGADEIPGWTPGAEVRQRSAEPARARGANRVLVGGLAGDPPVRPTRFFACPDELLAEAENASPVTLFAGSFSARDGLYSLPWDEPPGRIAGCERVGSYAGDSLSPERLARLAREKGANVALLDFEPVSEAMASADAPGVFLHYMNPLTVRFLRCSDDSELLAAGVLFGPDVGLGDRGCPAPGTATLVGLWESVDTSEGGIGHVVEFLADGGFVQAPTVLRDGFYRLIGDRLWVDDVPPHEEDVPSATRVEFGVRLEGDRLITTDPEGFVIEKERFGEAAGTPTSLVGTWQYRHPAGRTAFERYTADGRLLFRLPFSTGRGCYALRGDVVILTSPNGEEIRVPFELRDAELFLTRVLGGGPSGYRRSAEGAWYGQEQHRDELPR